MLGPTNSTILVQITPELQEEFKAVQEKWQMLTLHLKRQYGDATKILKHQIEAIESIKVTGTDITGVVKFLEELRRRVMLLVDLVIKHGSFNANLGRKLYEQETVGRLSLVLLKIKGKESHQGGQLFDQFNKILNKQIATVEKMDLQSDGAAAMFGWYVSLSSIGYGNVLYMIDCSLNSLLLRVSILYPLW